MAKSNEEYRNEVAGFISEDQQVSPISSSTWIISGTVTSGSIITGTITALQGTSPWVVSGTVDANVTVGLFDITLATGSNLAGSVTALQGTSPWVVSGTVNSTPYSPSGTQDVNIVSSSMLPITGTVTTLQGTSPWVMSGTVAQGTNPWAVGGTICLSTYDEDLLSSLYLMITKMMKINESLATVDSSQRLKIVIDFFSAGVTLPIVTTVATVTDVTSVNRLAGNDTRYIQMDTARNSYANGIRANISIT